MARIGKASRVGNIGNRGKRRGSIGKPGTTYGSSLTLDQDRIKGKYPTTSTV